MSLTRCLAPHGALLHSPLHDRHVALGAKMADFGGWEMPIEYPGGGVLKEHAAVRERGRRSSTSATSARASVRGPGAAAFVNACLTNDLGRSCPARRSTRCAATTTAAWSTT